MDCRFKRLILPFRLFCVQKRPFHCVNKLTMTVVVRSVMLMKFKINTIRERLRNAHPSHYLIFKGMAWVSLFVFLGKVAGAAKEMAVASRFGVSEIVDAYLFIINLIYWPVSLWFSVLSIVLIPLAARIRKDSLIELAQFRAELLGLTIRVGCVLSVGAYIGIPLLLNSGLTGFPESTIAIAMGMAPKLAIMALFGVLVSLFSAWTMSSGRHANTLLEGSTALTILVALLLFPGGGAAPLVWATVAGFAFNVVGLMVPFVWRGEIEKPKFVCRSPHWINFWQGFGIMLAGQTLMSFTTIIDQFFAARLGVGAIASISYANRILALILGLGATAVSRAALPVFSRMQSQGDGYQTQHIALHWVRIMFSLGIFTAMVSWYFAPSVVKLLFERGAFTAHNTQVVTEILRYWVLQIPFYFSALVLVAFLASCRMHKFIAVGAGINLFVKFSANAIFVPLMGVNGIIVATIIMYSVSFGTLYLFATVFLNNKRAAE